MAECWGRMISHILAHLRDSCCSLLRQKHGQRNAAGSVPTNAMEMHSSSLCFTSGFDAMGWDGFLPLFYLNQNGSE